MVSSEQTGSPRCCSSRPWTTTTCTSVTLHPSMPETSAEAIGAVGISEEETSVGETSNASPLDDAKPPTQSVIGRSGITAPVGAFFAHPERANGWVGLRYRKPQDP